jgi:hypothetical protein
MGLGAPHHALPPPVLDNSLRGLRAAPIIIIERTCGDSTVEFRAIASKLRLKSVENLLRQPSWVSRGLYHQRRHRADDSGFCHAGFAVACEIVDHLAAACRMADMDRVL